MARPKSKEQLVLLSLRLHPLQRRRLQEQARQQRKTVSAIVRDLIEENSNASPAVYQAAGAGVAA